MTAAETDGAVQAPSRLAEPGRGDAAARAHVQRAIAWLNPGWVVVGASLGLCLTGLYAIDLSRGLDDATISGLALKQAAFLGVGLVAGGVAASLHHRWLAYFAWPLAALSLVLLVFVLVPFVPDAIVTPRNGARRWINLGVVDFQPSELAKVVFVILVATYLRYRSEHRRYLGLLRTALLAFVPMALILVEPDLGTALLFMPTLLAMLVAAGARLVHLFGTCALGAAFAAVVVVASLAFAQSDRYPLLRPHQVERIQAVLDQIRGDERFVQDRGFQGRQAMMLIGAGGVRGHDDERTRALVEFSRLPERHNDMIFPVIVCRFGIVGALAVVGAYAMWFAGATLVAARCKDPFGRLLVVGIAAMVLTQAGINMGMTLGILPITGMTLPFVSYGGSSLLIGFVMTGLVLNVALRRPDLLWRPSFEFDADDDR